MRNKLQLFAYFALLPFISKAQLNPITATSAEIRMDGYKKIQTQSKINTYKGLDVQNIGPSIMGGRVVDLEVNPKDPSEFLVAYASGGLWHTTNNGQSFNPIFDHESVISIGDIAVDWKNRAIYVGTGESNSSRSSYSGDGIYKSTDWGKSWQNIGLPESHHIARILIDENSPNRIWVAVLGHLYSENRERGIYSSINGGKTWKQCLYVNNNTGGVDIVQDPLNPRILYASTWERSRRAWDFSGAGSGSGIYKSTNYGVTWSKQSTITSGFPTGEYTGRIGLAFANSGKGSVLYALVDNQKPNITNKAPKQDEITAEQIRKCSKEGFLSLNKEALKKFLTSNGYPKKYNADTIFQLVKLGKFTPNQIVDYIGDANAALFNTDYPGAEIYASRDEGQTFTKTHDKPLKGLYFTYGYYFGNIRINPKNPNHIYLLGFLLAESKDGGKTVTNISKDNVHADHHALWINPRSPRHMINGNDGGLVITYDGGKHWSNLNEPSVGQFYSVAVEQTKDGRVYGGLQDNGVWMGPKNNNESPEWKLNGNYPYKQILGGDGMQVGLDTRNRDLVYSAFQFGNFYKINTQNGQISPIAPKHELGEKPYRWNWQSPIKVSTHNQDVIYLGANYLFRSLDQGKTFQKISSDLTLGGKKGNVPYGTLTSIDESPYQFGKIYVGTDDGLVYVSNDAGVNWKKISTGLPENLWVSRISASTHKANKLYVALNGYRWDNFRPYVYVSESNGNAWRNISETLPNEPVNVIKEDPNNENLLLVGTDNGAYISINGGKEFTFLTNDFPRVAVHDIAFNKETHEAFIASHGRSIYKVDLNLLDRIKSDKLSLKDRLNIKDTVTIDRDSYENPALYDTYDEPRVAVQLYAYKAAIGKVKIKSGDGKIVSEQNFNINKGLNAFNISLLIKSGDLTSTAKPIESGSYDYTIDLGSESYSGKMCIK